MQLDPAALAEGVRLVEHDTLGSTNAEALLIARAGERGPLWVTARRQTAGRGRRGRDWVSEPGNLYATLLLNEPAPTDKAAELSFVAALAVLDAVRALAPHLAGALALKWPNDGLIAGKKFCGILVEGEGPAVVIGIGVNCAHHPAQTRYPATDLATAGAAMTPQALFAQLSTSMVRRIRQWNRGAAFEGIRSDWLACAAGVGKAMRVSLPDCEREGCFESIDACGRLVLRRVDGGRETIAAGDVIALAESLPVAAAEC